MDVCEAGAAENEKVLLLSADAERDDAAAAAGTNEKLPTLEGAAADDTRAVTGANEKLAAELTKPDDMDDDDNGVKENVLPVLTDVDTAAPI